MKIISILVVLCALASLLGVTVRWGMHYSFLLGVSIPLNEWIPVVAQICSFLRDAGSGFAILLLGIALAIQTFKKEKTPSFPKPEGVPDRIK